MATHTTYYNLTKPSQNDKVNIGVLNDNADIIDTTLHNKVNSDELTADNVMMSDGVTSVEDALSDIRCGIYENAPSVQPSTNAEITVPFGYTFSAPPVVTANLYGTLNLTDMIGVNIKSVSTTEFVVRVRNVNTVSALTPKISWIAMLK